MSAKTQLQSDLLRQGAESYVDALAAIEAFRQQVERVCQGAYDRQEPRLRAAMGLDPEKCKRYDDPNPEDREADLGIRRSAQDSGQRFYIYLQWGEVENSTPEVRAAICLDVYPRKTRDQIFDNIRRMNPKQCHLEKDNGVNAYLLLAAPIKLNELNALPEMLDRLVSEWIGYCESIGGLKLKGTTGSPEIVSSSESS